MVDRKNRVALLIMKRISDQIKKGKFQILEIDPTKQPGFLEFIPMKINQKVSNR